MKSRKQLLASLAILSAIGVAVIALDSRNPARGEDQNPLAAAPAPSGGSLSVEQLGDALETYGKNTTTNNGHTDYSIFVKRGKWNINIIISESPNGSIIWMTNGLTAMPPANQLDMGGVLNILKKNTDIGPMFFSIAGDSLRISYPLANANLTADKLHDRIEAMVSTVVDTEGLWSDAGLTGKAANGG